MAVIDIENMTIVERLQAIEELWDSLPEHKAQYETPQWQRNVLTERMAKIKSGQAKFLSLDELAEKKHAEV